MIRYFKNTTHGCHTSDDVKCSMNNYSWKFLSFWFSSFYINILINFFSFFIENRDRIMSSSSYRHVMDIPNWESWDTESTDLLYENNMATEGWMLSCDRIRPILMDFYWLSECKAMTRQVQYDRSAHPSLSLVKKLKKSWGFGKTKSQTDGVPLSAQQSQGIPWTPFFSLIFILDNLVSSELQNLRNR